MNLSIFGGSTNGSKQYEASPWKSIRLKQEYVVDLYGRDDHVWISYNDANKTIQKYKSNGELVWEKIGVNPGKIHVSENGKIYIFDTPSMGHISMYDEEAKFIKSMNLGGSSYIRSVNTDADENIYLCRSPQNIVRIVKFNQNGDVIWESADFETSYYVNRIEFSTDGSILALSGKELRKISSSSGATIKSVVCQGYGIGTIEIDQTGNVYTNEGDKVIKRDSSLDSILWSFQSPTVGLNSQGFKVIDDKVIACFGLDMVLINSDNAYLIESYKLDENPQRGFYAFAVTSNKYLFKDGEEIKKYGKGPTLVVEEYTADVCTGGTPFIYSEWYSYPIGNAFDNGAAFAASYYNPTAGYIGYDFGTNKKHIRKLTINQDHRKIGGGSATEIQIQRSDDDNNWINVGGLYPAEAIGITVVQVPASQPSRYWRIKPTQQSANYRWGGIIEVEMMEVYTRNILQPNEWSLIQEEGLGLTELFDIHGMSDLSLINDEAMQQLSSDQVELLCWTDEVAPSRQVGITGIPHHAILASSNDIPLEGAEKVTLAVNQATGAVIQIAVSSDEGVTWKGKSSLTMSDLSSVKANGFTPEELNALTKEQLATLFPNGTARFAFYLEQDNITDVVEIQSLSVGEKQYTISPTATDLSLIYEVLQEEKPTLYASRDDGVSWKEISQDEMASLSEQPEGNSLRVKAVLKNGQEIHAMSYAWA